MSWGKEAKGKAKHCDFENFYFHITFGIAIIIWSVTNVNANIAQHGQIKAMSGMNY